MPKFSRYQGLVYRAHDPRWSFLADSGEGARLKGGRFNPKGIAALYTSTSFQGAWNEAQQGFSKKPQPLTLCSYQVDCEDIVDLTCSDTRNSLGIKISDLASGWLIKPKHADYPVTQQLALNLIKLGAAGILVQSFANNAAPSDVNLVFWRWTKHTPYKVLLIDDDDRLQSKASGI